MKDKNLRPYAVAIDWLQLSCRRTEQFNPASDTLTHHYQDVGHGSKVFKDIYNVIDDNGQLIGNVSVNPYNSAISPDTAIFKADNTILYEPDAIQRIFIFLSEAGLKYKGITRIDLAYDCHEYYGGLHPANLLQRYFSMKYLKLGNNSPWVKYEGGYSLKINPKKDYKTELEKGKLGQFAISSVTWGNRSSDIQVQVYNKSRELREVKMKPHIVEYWRRCELEPDKKEVYRTEIRLTGLRTVQNNTNGKLFRLQASDILLQAQLEHLFAAFAKKYFRFYHRRNITHIERMPQVKLLCIAKETIFTPKYPAAKKTYKERSLKILRNWIERQLYENAKEGNELVYSLQSVKEYLDESLKIGDKLKIRDHKDGKKTEQPVESILDYETIVQYYADMYAASDNELFTECAKHQRELEKQRRETMNAVLEEEALQKALEYEEKDPSPVWVNHLMDRDMQCRLQARAGAIKRQREERKREAMQRKESEKAAREAAEIERFAKRFEGKNVSEELEKTLTEIEKAESRLQDLIRYKELKKSGKIKTETEERKEEKPRQGEEPERYRTCETCKYALVWSGCGNVISCGIAESLTIVNPVNVHRAKYCKGYEQK